MKTHRCIGKILWTAKTMFARGSCAHRRVFTKPQPSKAGYCSFHGIWNQTNGSVFTRDQLHASFTHGSISCSWKHFNCETQRLCQEWACMITHVLSVKPAKRPCRLSHNLSRPQDANIICRTNILKKTEETEEGPTYYRTRSGWEIRVGLLPNILPSCFSWSPCNAKGSYGWPQLKVKLHVNLL